MTDPPSTDQPAQQLEVIRQQRKTLQKLREQEEIGDDAFHRVEHELDIAELALTSRLD